jgi:hypothetical protein
MSEAVQVPEVVATSVKAVSVTLVVETEPVCLVIKFVVEVVVMSSHCTCHP